MFESVQDAVRVVEEIAALTGRLVQLVGPECSGAVADEVFAGLAGVHRQVELAQCLTAERVDRSGVWQDGSSSATAYLAKSSGQSGPWASARLTTGRSLVDELPATRAAWAAGKIGLEQARLIRSAVADLDTELTARIEETLANTAPSITLADLRGLAEMIRQAAAPEAAAERDRQRFHQQSVTLSPTFGGFALNGWLNVENGALLRDALEHFMPQPARPVSKAAVAETAMSPKLRRALGLIEMARQAMAHDTCGATGPAKPTIVLTLPYEDFKARYGSGEVTGGGTVSAAAVRRLACDAKVLPMQLSGQGVPVELGRTRRTVSTALRLLLNQRDKGCVFDGCDRPPSWCDAHHLHEWAAGGPTNPDNLALLCHFHHHALHEGGWTHTGTPGRDLQFHPPSNPIRRT